MKIYLRYNAIRQEYQTKAYGDIENKKELIIYDIDSKKILVSSNKSSFLIRRFLWIEVKTAQTERLYRQEIVDHIKSSNFAVFECDDKIYLRYKDRFYFIRNNRAIDCFIFSKCDKTPFLDYYTQSIREQLERLK